MKRETKEALGISALLAGLAGFIVWLFWPSKSSGASTPSRSAPSSGTSGTSTASGSTIGNTENQSGSEIALVVPVAVLGGGSGDDTHNVDRPDISINASILGESSVDPPSFVVGLTELSNDPFNPDKPVDPPRPGFAYVVKRGDTMIGVCKRAGYVKPWNAYKAMLADPLNSWQRRGQKDSGGNEILSWNARYECLPGKHYSYRGQYYNGPTAGVALGYPVVRVPAVDEVRI